jgi:copper chaperone NosL
MTRRHLLGAIAAAALTAACRSTPRSAAPADIAYGRDPCEFCRMPIDEPQLAAEFIDVGGRAHKFGEPGCLVNWMRKGTAPAGTAFVTDAGRGGWLPAAAAAYVTGRVRTPMAYDVTAHRSPPADTPAERVRTWDALLAEGVAGAPVR